MPHCRLGHLKARFAIQTKGTDSGNQERNELGHFFKSVKISSAQQKMTLSLPKLPLPYNQCCRNDIMHFMKRK